MVDVLAVAEVWREEAGAYALDLVGAGLAAAQDGRFSWLNCVDFQVRILRAEEPGRALERTASADAADEDVNLAVSLLPELGAGRVLVHQHIVWVIELLEHVTFTLLGDLLGHQKCTAHSLGAGRENDLSSEGEEDRTPLEAHRVRHDHDALVALRGGDHRERDASVARGRLDERIARLDVAAQLGDLYHRPADAVLDRVARIVRLHLCHDVGVQALRQLCEPEARCVADELDYRVGNLRLVANSFSPITNLWIVDFLH